MIENLSISSVQYEADDSIKKYISKKIGRLDRFAPRHSRKTMKAEVVLREVNREHGNKYECEVTIIAPNKVFHAQDSTGNIFAAVDIVESKLNEQIRKHKDATMPKRGWRARSILRRQNRTGIS